MIVIGITGGIGTGKSTVAAMIEAEGIPVFSSDRVVHELLMKKGALQKKIGTNFRGVLENGQINRQRLGELVFNNPNLRRKLEQILHPLIREAELSFIAKERKKKRASVALEIPLLYETGAERLCDVVICTTAPLKIRKERVLKRKGMTNAKFLAIQKSQMPEKDKRKRADYLIKTSQSQRQTKKEIIHLLKNLVTRQDHR